MRFLELKSARNHVQIPLAETFNGAKNFSTVVYRDCCACRTRSYKNPDASAVNVCARNATDKRRADTATNKTMFRESVNSSLRNLRPVRRLILQRFNRTHYLLFATWKQKSFRANEKNSDGVELTTYGDRSRISAPGVTRGVASPIKMIFCRTLA